MFLNVLPTLFPQVINQLKHNILCFTSHPAVTYSTLLTTRIQPNNLCFYGTENYRTFFDERQPPPRHHPRAIQPVHPNQPQPIAPCRPSTLRAAGSRCTLQPLLIDVFYHATKNSGRKHPKRGRKASIGNVRDRRTRRSRTGLLSTFGEKTVPHQLIVKS